MKIRWFGQSAFLLSGSARVAIDPFGDVQAAVGERGLQFAYPLIEGVDADLLLVTHEHFDHNGADAIGGDPHTIRSTAGTFESPVGEVTAIASEHDDAAAPRWAARRPRRSSTSWRPGSSWRCTTAPTR